MHALYRLRDAVALTRPELSVLCAMGALLALGVAVKHLPEPPTVLSPQTIAYAAQFEKASERTATSDEPVSTDVGASLPVPTREVGAEEPRRPTRTRKAPAPAAPVGINTATGAQLETLPRIGPAMAKRILDYRAARGGFRRVEDLRNVKGIGAKTLDALRPFVTLD